MRLALGVEYNGYAFHGWQSQPGKIRTVQSTLEQGLSRVADEPIKLICAGRTDTGVHALGQVVHFDTNVVRQPIAWVFGVNSFLPSDIRVQWMQPVEDDFHARFSALARTYQYVILNQANHSALLHRLVTWECRPLSIQPMQQAALYLTGTHDFSSFRSSECQANSPIRTINDIQIYYKDSLIYITICANAFLHHMVRNIIGVLLLVGKGEKSPEWVKTVVLAKSRQAAAKTAAANGLYLTYVTYPQHWLKLNISKKIDYGY